MINVNLKYKAEPTVDGILTARGIHDVDAFLNPTEDNLNSPLLLGQSLCEKAYEWIKEYSDGKMLLVIDSDCDGYCSSAIFYQYMKKVYPNCDLTYIAHEGKQHGLEDIVKILDLDEYSLVFVPDGGTNDDNYFRSHPNTHFIILDHHEKSSLHECPENAVIINNQLADNYPNKALCGTGVTWQFCRYMDSQIGEEYAQEFADLVAVATIADIMNLTTIENRYILHYGLANIKNTFIQHLYDNAAFKIGKELTPIGVAFYMAPMINAMCRMGSIEEKYRMFLALINPYELVDCNKRGAKGTQVAVVTESVRECTNAKSRQQRMQEKVAELCNKKIIEDDLLSNKIITIVLDETFDKVPTEMNGVSAIAVAKEYDHPVLIGRVNSNGNYSGSIRGLETINMPILKEFLLSSGLFNYVEGHGLAAGFEIPYSKLDKFHQWANEQLKDVSMGEKTWQVDYQLNAAEEDIGALVGEMDLLKSAWGTGFPEVKVHIQNITVKRSDIQVIGSASDTVKITHKGVCYMFFKCPISKIKELTAYNEAVIEVVGTTNMNEYYGRKTPQIFCEDFSIKDNTFGF